MGRLGGVLGPLGSFLGRLGGLLGRFPGEAASCLLGPSLEASWRSLGASWTLLGASRRSLGAFGNPRGPSWRRLGGVLGPLGGLRVCSVAGSPHAPNRILHDFLDILRNIIRNIRNDMRKEIRIMILLGYGTLYAMRRHKAWRGGSNAQQSCVPATAPKRKVAKLHFVCLSIPIGVRYLQGWNSTSG